MIIKQLIIDKECTVDFIFLYDQYVYIINDRKERVYHYLEEVFNCTKASHEYVLYFEINHASYTLLRLDNECLLMKDKTVFYQGQQAYEWMEKEIEPLLLFDASDKQELHAQSAMEKNQAIIEKLENFYQPYFNILHRQLESIYTYQQHYQEKQFLLQQLHQLEEEYKTLKTVIHKKQTIYSTMIERINNENNLKNEYKHYQEVYSHAIERIRKMHVLSAYQDKLINLSDELVDLQDNYRLLESAYYAQKSAYDTLEKQYMAGQAGILALSLQENQPCPVCGSVHHPCIAQVDQYVPIEKLQQQEKKVNALYQEFNDNYQNLLVKKDAIEKLQNNLSVLKKELGIDEELTKQFFIRTLDASFRQTKKIEGMHKHYDEELNYIQKLKKTAPYEYEIIEGLNCQEKELQSNIMETKEKLKAYEEIIPQPMQSFDECKNRINTLVNSISHLQEIAVLIEKYMFI